MGKRTKREIFLFSASDIKATEEHFEKMASRGWILNEINQYSVKYKREEAQELKVSLDIFPEPSALNMPADEEISEYRDLCIDAGWTFLASSNRLQVFSSKKSDKLAPIQSDEAIEEATIKKSIYSEMISWIAILPIYILALWNLSSFNYEDLYYNISIVYLIFPIAIIPLLVHIISQVLWLRNAKKAIDKGDALPKTSYKFFRFKIVLLLTTIIFLFSFFGLAIILDLFIGNYAVLIGLIPILLAILSMPIYKKMNKNSEKIGKESKINTLIVSTIGLVIGITIVSFGIMISFSNTNRTNDLKEGYLGLKLRDFNLASPNRLSFSRSGSILIPKSSTYYEISRGNSIRTEYTKAINNKMAQYIFDSILEENYNRFSGEISSAREEYENFDEAFYLDQGKESILLLSDKMVFEIVGGLDLSIEENKDIITNRLLNE